ncbi:MAG: hypothetical protein ACYC4R_17490 [Anaerolineae bacterium]
MIDSPVFLVSSGLATVWAALFHLILGKRLPDLILFWFVGLLGFAIGQAMSELFHMQFLMLGSVHVIQGTLGCWMAMLVARWLKV